MAVSRICAGRKRPHRCLYFHVLTAARFVFDQAPLEPAVRAEVRYRNADVFLVGPTFDLAGERYADFSNTYKMESNALWDLRAGVVRKNWEVCAEPAI